MDPCSNAYLIMLWPQHACLFCSLWRKMKRLCLKPSIQDLGTCFFSVVVVTHFSFTLLCLFILFLKMSWKYRLSVVIDKKKKKGKKFNCYPHFFSGFLKGWSLRSCLQSWMPGLLISCFLLDWQTVIFKPVTWRSFVQSWRNVAASPSWSESFVTYVLYLHFAGTLWKWHLSVPECCTEHVVER